MTIQPPPPQKNKKKKVGRPQKGHLIEDIRLQKIMECLRMDGTIEEACHYAKLPASTLYDWIAKKKYFLEKFSDGTQGETLIADAIEQAKQYPLMLARRTIFRSITQGDSKLAFELLKRRDSRYRDKQEIGSPQDFPSVDDYIDDA